MFISFCAKCLIIVIINIASRKLPGCFGVPIEYASLIEEFEQGHSAIIHCPSNDAEHNFMFWQLNDRKLSIIGPGNEYNRSKYEYEVLSGKLFIKHVETSDEGTYSCISRAVHSNRIQTRNVKLIVKKDWEEVYEEDPTVNTLRVLIVIGLIGIIVGISFLIYYNWKSKAKIEKILEETEDERGERNDECLCQLGPSHFSGSTSPLLKNVNVINKENSLEDDQLFTLYDEENESLTQSKLTSEKISLL